MKKRQRKPAGPKREHDALFRGAYSTKEVALAHLHSFLPPDQLASLVLEEIYLQSDSYVSGQLKSYFSDVVWQCPLRNSEGKVKISFLFEHKSSPPDIPIEGQLAPYVANIWARERNNKEPLSIVVPIVVYHGSRPWPNDSIAEFFPGTPANLHGYFLNIDYVLTDLSSIPESLIKANEMLGALRSLFLAFKYAFDPVHLKENFSDILIFVATSRGPFFDSMLTEMLLTYIQKRLDMDTREMENLIESLPEAPRKIALSTYDRILAKGREEGLQKGREEGLQKGREEGLQKGREEGLQKAREEIAVNLLLHTDMSDEQIAQLAQLPLERVMELRQEA